jgi:type II secretory pathway component PulM
MTSWFDKLNLEPQERRLVLVAVVVVAVVLNYWLVWPYFQDWGKVNKELDDVLRVKTRYETETTRTNAYHVRLNNLRRQGAEVAPEDAPNRLQGTILAEANTTGVQVNRLIPITQAARTAGNQTNQFFEEYQVTAEVAAGEAELVDFLHRLGAGDSMVRVRDVNNLRLDPSQTKLTCTLTLVASFPRRAQAPPPPTRKPVGPTGVAPKSPTAPASTNRNVRR